MLSSYSFKNLIFKAAVLGSVASIALPVQGSQTNLGRTLVLLRQDCPSSLVVAREGDPCDSESQHRTNSLELLIRGQLRGAYDRLAVWKLPATEEASVRAGATLREVALRGTLDLWVLPEGPDSVIDGVVATWLGDSSLHLHQLVWSGGRLQRSPLARLDHWISVPEDPTVARAGWIDFVQVMAAHEKMRAVPSMGVLDTIWRQARLQARNERMAGRFGGQLAPWVLPGERPAEGRVTEETVQEGWKFYEAAFPHPLAGIPGEVDEEGEQAWIDGDGLKLLSSQLERFLGPVGKQLIGSVMGVRLVSQADGFLVSLHSRRPQTITWGRSEALPGGKGLWTGFSLPSILRARMRLSDGVLWVDAQREEKPFLVNLSLQGFPLGVEFRGAGIDLDSGAYEVEAGLMGGAIRLVARGKLFSREWDGIDFWESIRRSAGGWSATPALFQESPAKPN